MNSLVEAGILVYAGIAVGFAVLISRTPPLRNAVNRVGESAQARAIMAIGYSVLWLPIVILALVIAAIEQSTRDE